MEPEHLRAVERAVACIEAHRGGRLDLERGADGLRLKARLPLQARANEIRPSHRPKRVAGEERSFAPRRLELDAGRAPPGLA